MLKTERGKLEFALDHEFRWAVRERDGWKCQSQIIGCKGLVYVPPTKALQCSHFWGCAARHTRWDLKNGDAQCGGCHMYFTANPHEHVEWKKARMTTEDYDALRLRAHTTKKWTLSELEDLIESLQQYRETLKYDEDKKAAPF